MCLNPKTIVGAKLRSTKLVGLLDFKPGLSNFNEVIKVIENVTSLKGKIFVNIKQDHFVISVLKNIDAFFLRFKHQVPFIKVKKPSLGWKRREKKGERGEIN